MNINKVRDIKMNRIAIFGKPANGKSTLSKVLSHSLGINSYSIDSILYQANGAEIPSKRYQTIHQSIISSEKWIIEGFGPLSSLNSFYERIEAADTLIYIDLTYPVTYLLVIKRLLKGVFRKPDGWPEGTSILKGTINSFKVLQHCPKFWNAKFIQKIQKSENKKVIVIKSLKELNDFMNKHK